MSAEGSKYFPNHDQSVGKADVHKISTSASKDYGNGGQKPARQCQNGKRNKNNSISQSIMSPQPYEYRCRIK